MKLRVKFSKNGPIKYIGHLDTMRYFQKAVRRAGIKVKYSGGFSPHQIMSFAYPLGVGMTTDGDYMDIEVEEASSSFELIESMNAVMAEGIEVLDVVELPEKSQNAMASVAASAYLVRFRDGKQPFFDLQKASGYFNEAPTIPYVKKTAKSEIELDLKQSVYEFRVESDCEIYMMLDSSSGGNVKPSLVLDAIYAHFGEELPEFATSVHRLDTYMRNEAGELVPLLSAGVRF